MPDFVTKRRLYLGAGQFVEKDAVAPDMTPAERERLLASGAIGKAAPKHENKNEDAPESRSRGRRRAN